MENFLFSSIEGNRQNLDGGAMFGNAPRALWSRWEPCDEKGCIPLACRSLLIEKGDLKILCETGIGAFWDPKMAKRYGVQNQNSHELLKNLQKKGIREEDIDYVILSHLHFDHAGGLLPSYQEQQRGKTDLCFPKAFYVVGRKAFERAKNPHLRDRASFILGLTDKLEQSQRLILVDDGRPALALIKDSISFIFTQGHTPGQMHLLFTDEIGEKIFFAGDLIPGQAWIHLPITMGYDRFPEKLVEEKKTVYEKACKEKWWIFFTHDKANCAARVRKNSKGMFEVYQEKTILDRSTLSSLKKGF